MDLTKFKNNYSNLDKEKNKVNEELNSTKNNFNKLKDENQSLNTEKI